MHRPKLIAFVLAFGFAACGGTYHPPTADQAIITTGPGSQPGAVSTLPAGSTGTTGPASGPGVSGPAISQPPASNVGRQIAAQGGVIKVGGVFPLSGPIGAIGRAYYEGVQSYFSYINERGGIGGAKIQYIVEDDQFDPARGKALIRKLIEKDKVFSLAGILSPFTVLAGLPDIRKAGTPVLPTGGTDGREFGEKLLFSSYQPCERIFPGNADYAVKTLRLTKIAIITINIETGRLCVDATEKAAENAGGQVVYRGEVAPGGADCTSHILRSVAQGAQILLLVTDNLGIVKCIQAKNQQGWDAPVSVSANSVDDPVFVEALGENAEGLLATSPFTGVNSAQFEAFCGAGLRRFFPNARLQFYHIVGCTGARHFVTAMSHLGPNATQADLVNYLESGVTFSSGGLAPDISYRPNAHPPYLHHPMDVVRPLELRNGRWVSVGALFHPTHA